MTQMIACNPGLDNAPVYKALEIKVNTMLEQDRHCILCIDEMSIKSNLCFDIGHDEIIGFEDLGSEERQGVVCCNALVIMVRGLYSAWKQPLAYFFVGSQLKAVKLRPIMANCIQKLFNIGLIVEGIASDMGSNFIELSKLLGVTESSEFELDGRKLVYIFDPCHLIKATRNNLLKNSFHFDNKITSWSFIKTFYEEDSKKFYRCAPKLTNSHINPTNFEKMKVSLATQVLSHSVACGMNVALSYNVLPAQSLGTIESISIFNNLFDLLNAFSLRHPNKFKNAFDGSEFQIKFLTEAIEYLQQIKIINKDGQNITNKIKFHKCWIITINSILKMWEKLSKLNFLYLKTRRINTDCLENFFGSVRQQSGNNVNPTPIQFKRAFRKLFCQNFFHSNHMNCREDFDSLLIDIKSTNVADVFIHNQDDQPLKALVLPDYDYIRENMVTNNAFTYVCGYLLKKSLGVHSCDDCKHFGKNCDDLDFNNLLIHFKAFETQKRTFGGLQTPPEEFVHFIFKLERAFNENFDKFCNGKGVSNKLYKLIEDIDFYHPCTSFPKTYVKKLFIRMKIFYTLKYNNRDLKSNKTDKKSIRKVKILSHL